MTLPLCPAINHSLFVNTNGDVKPCCAGADPLGNINEQSFTDILANPKIIEIRNGLLTQEFPNYCKVCKVIEDTSSGTSQMSFIKKTYEADDSTDLKHLDLRWSNTCNLSCRYCSQIFSSQWEKVLGIAPQSVNKSYHDSIFDYIQEHSATITNVSLLGGEPLMQKQNEKLLQVLGPDVSITVTTNLSNPLDNNRIFNMLSDRGSRVNWKISFDNVGEHFEYVRYGASWDLLESNLNKLKTISNFVSIGAVYSIYNATKLVDFIKFLNVYRPASFYLSPVSVGKGNNSLSIFEQSARLKELAIAELEQVESMDMSGIRNADEVKSIIYNTIAGLIITPEDYRGSLLSFIQNSERMMPYKKSFAELWPEIYSVIS